MADTSTTVADREPAIHLGNARLRELGDLNVLEDAKSLYQKFQLQTATVALQQKHLDREQAGVLMPESFDPQSEEIPEFCPAS